MKRWFVILVTIICVLSLSNFSIAAYPTTTTHSKLYPYTSIQASPYSCDPTGTIDIAAAIEQIKANQSNSGTIYFPHGTYKLATNLTIPSGMEIVREAGSTISISTGVTLTIGCSINGPKSQFFTQTGTAAVIFQSTFKQEIKSFWFSSLTNAVASASTNTHVLRVSRDNWPVSADLSVPITCALKVDKGAYLQIATTKTLTINGGLVAGLYQIFTCTGTGKAVFGDATNPSKVLVIYPEWWGAIPGVNMDCGPAIQAALDADHHGSRVELQHGSTGVGSGGEDYYKVSTALTITKSYTELRGKQWNAGIMWTGAVSATLLNVSNGASALLGVKLNNLILHGGNLTQWLIKGYYTTQGCEFNNIWLYGSVGYMYMNICNNAKFDGIKCASGVDGLAAGMTQAQWNEVYQTYAPLTFLQAHIADIRRIVLTDLGTTTTVGGLTPNQLIQVSGSNVLFNNIDIEALRGYATKANAVTRLFEVEGTGSKVKINNVYLESVYCGSFINVLGSTTAGCEITNVHGSACAFSANPFLTRHSPYFKLKNVDFWDSVAVHATTAQLVEMAAGYTHVEVDDILIHYGPVIVVGGKQYTDTGIGNYGIVSGAYVYPGGVKIPVVSGLTVTNSSDATGEYILVEPGFIYDMNGTFRKIGPIKNSTYVNGTGWMFRPPAAGTINFRVCVEPSGCVFIENTTAARSSVARGRITLATFTSTDGVISALVSHATGGTLDNSWIGEFTNNYANKKVYAAAVPATGTWAVGDRWVKTNPAKDGNQRILIGGVCTVAPSTWENEFVSSATW